MNGSTPAESAASKDLKAENKRLAVTFKAQHGLIVAFFTLILYVDNRIMPSFSLS